MTVPEQSTKNFSIRLNSDGLCFICLRDTKHNGGDQSPPTSFRLRNITRFLGIDSKKILKAYLDYDLKRCSDVKVELCEGCSEQVLKFNCLYETLELTKLKLNECVQKISSLIREAEEECNDDRTSEMERRVTHAATKGVIVDLRTGISEKCLKFSKTVPPRVILKRLPEREVAKFLCRDRVATGSHTTTPTPIKIEVPGEDDESRSFTDNDLAASQASDSDTGSVIESVIAQEQRQTQKGSGLKPSSKSYHPDGNFPCPFCKAVCVIEQELRRHLVSFHLQAQYFPEEEYKEPFLSSQQFTLVVTYLLFKNIYTTHPVTESVSRCPHCSKTFDRRKVADFKLHLIQNHQASLIEKLNQLQQDPMLLEKLLKIRNAWICKCGVHVAMGKTLNTHQQKFCSFLGNTPGNVAMENLTVAKQILEIDHQQINSSQSVDGTLRASCPHCAAVFAKKAPSLLKLVLEMHLSAFHLHTFFPEEDLKEPSLSSYQFQQVIQHHLFANISNDPENTTLVKCPNCNETAPKYKASSLRMHVIKFHYESLVQRLKELQKDSMILEKLSKISEKLICNCGEYFSNPNQYNLHRSKYCKLIRISPTNAKMTRRRVLKQKVEIVYQQSYSSISKSADGTLQNSCSHCKAVFKSNFLQDLNAITWIHLVSFHLHIFFPEDKHKDPSLSSYQFKHVIHHLLFEHIGSEPDTKSKRTIYKCPYCKVTVKRSTSRLKLHLLKYHYLSLTQRLEQLQKDALIFKKLKNVRITAFLCQCGDYFVFIRHFKLHQQKFCKLTSSSRETGSSTSNTERDPLELDDEERFEAHDDEPFSDSEDRCSIDIEDVKPNINIGAKTEAEGIVASERKRRASELDSDSDSGLPETNCSPQKVIKLDLL